MSTGWVRGTSACAFALLWSLSAQALPLGLEVGDQVTSISVGGFQSDGQGGAYTLATGLVDGTGDATSLEANNANDPPGDRTVLLSNTTIAFSVEFVSENVDLSNLPLVEASSVLTGPAAVDPDFVILENGSPILSGDFVGDLNIGGTFLATNPAAEMSIIGEVEFTDGDPLLLAALGGNGGMANVEFTAQAGGFSPPLGQNAEDGAVFDEDFSFDYSGSLIPQNSSPIVPEPATALLLAGGLLGLATRGRTRRR